MLISKFANVSTLSGPLLAPLNIAFTYSLSSTDNNPFQRDTNSNATSNPCQMFYQLHTAPNIGPSAILPSSISTVSQINSSSGITKNHTVPSVAVDKSVETFDGLDHQYTPGKNVNQIDAHIILYHGRKISRSGKRRNGIYTMFAVWNRFRLVYRTS